MLERGESVPLPKTDDDYSGHFTVRAPKWLHRELARRAKEENTSLNQFVITQLARRV